MTPRSSDPKLTTGASGWGIVLVKRNVRRPWETSGDERLAVEDLDLLWFERKNMGFGVLVRWLCNDFFFGFHFRHKIATFSHAKQLELVAGSGAEWVASAATSSSNIFLGPFKPTNKARGISSQLQLQGHNFWGSNMSPHLLITLSVRVVDVFLYKSSCWNFTTSGPQVQTGFHILKITPNCMHSNALLAWRQFCPWWTVVRQARASKESYGGRVEGFLGICMNLP